MKSYKEYLNAKTPSLEELMSKHSVSQDHITKQLNMGIEIEMEHTKHVKIAREIALDHLGEDPEYYSKLKKMEKK